MLMSLCKAALFEDATNIISLEYRNTMCLIYQVTPQLLFHSPDKVQEAVLITSCVVTGVTRWPRTPRLKAAGAALTHWNVGPSSLSRSVCAGSVFEKMEARTRGGSLLPVNLCSRLGMALSLPHAEGLLLLTDLLQPLLLQEQHQGVPHVHHLDQLLEDVLFFFTLLWALLCQANTVVYRLTRLWAASQGTFHLTFRLVSTRASRIHTSDLHELPEF